MSWFRPFGIVYSAKGKPGESWGRKATGLKVVHPTIAGLPNEVKEECFLRGIGYREAEINSRRQVRQKRHCRFRKKTGARTELMKLILFSQSRAAARHVDVSVPLVTVSGIGLVGLVAGLGFLVARAIGPVQPVADVSQLQHDVAAQQMALNAIEGRAQEQIDALTMRMGELNAGAIRLNALGGRLANMADLDEGEFNFENPPAIGGPAESEVLTDSAQGAAFFADINTMDRKLHDQEQQLMVLEGLLLNRRLNDRVFPKGRPVKAGWISSYFGRRTDPFTGKTTSHRGVDFAGKAGGDVIAVAAGVVTYSGPRSGYGNMVEINHGNGYVTRYAHNQRNLVAPGDQIQPGQTIALVGATGRATGPNVHFEVWHRGAPVNPVKYVRDST